MGLYNSNTALECRAGNCSRRTLLWTTAAFRYLDSNWRRSPKSGTQVGISARGFSLARSPAIQNLKASPASLRSSHHSHNRKMTQAQKCTAALRQRPPVSAGHGQPRAAGAHRHGTSRAGGGCGAGPTLPDGAASLSVTGLPFASLALRFCRQDGAAADLSQTAMTVSTRLSIPRPADEFALERCSNNMPRPKRPCTNVSSALLSFGCVR